MMINGSSGTWHVYGNLWYGGGTSSGPYNRLLETQQGTNGPVYFYNNTVVGLWATWTSANNGVWNAGSTSQNNIYWDCNGSGLPNQSHDFCSGTCGGSNSISNGSNPFANLSAGDFHIVSTVDATYPRDKGINLRFPYSVDRTGNARGGDGTWDIGAYEYTSRSSSIVTPPTPAWLKIR